MARNRLRPSRGALVACAPPLARIHERIFRALGIRESGVPGRPGGGCLLLSERGDLESFGLQYFASEWLSKLDDGKPSPSKVAATWERFAQAESSCFEVNQRLKREWASSPWSQEISLAIKLTSRILGKFDWDEAARGFGWGPGATTRLNRRLSDAAHKYSGSPHATIGNAVLANTVLQWSPLWKRELPELSEEEGVGYVKIVPGNRVVTVPKNYKTDRTIAIEPDMNVYVQQGIGKMMRDRLARAGIDLSDQTRNQRAALIGSFAGTLATIDLSMASDTVSRSLVELLLPTDWLEALGQCRSPFGVLPSGEKIFYQKFSSMGNSYTFELETVIFYSLALAVCHLMKEEVTRVVVYGDDIIVPSAAAERLMGLLQYVGLTPNAKKSYYTGPFRESCGKHYYLGHDVTPFYVKKAPSTLLDLFKIHNQLFRFINRMRWLNDEQVMQLRRVLSWLRAYAPAKYRRPSLLDGCGDGAFVGYFDEVTPQRAHRGWDGFFCKGFVALPVSEELQTHGLLCKAVARFGVCEDRTGRLQANPVLLKEEPEEVKVFPIRKQRYVWSEKVYIPRSFSHRQCDPLVL